jgi:hypothetical protein
MVTTSRAPMGTGSLRQLDGKEAQNPSSLWWTSTARRITVPGAGRRRAGRSALPWGHLVHSSRQFRLDAPLGAPPGRSDRPAMGKDQPKG